MTRTLLPASDAADGSSAPWPAIGRRDTWARSIPVALPHCAAR